MKKVHHIFKKQQYKYAGLAIIIVASVALVGGNLIQQTHAAPNNSFYLAPASGSYTVGSTLTVAVHEYSTDTITAMEADFSYTSNLTYQSEDFSSSAFKYQPPSGNGASGGVVSVQNSGPGLTGDQIVGTVTFAVNAPGTATLSFKNTSQLINSNGTNVLASSQGGSYTLAAAPAPAPPPAPAPAPGPSAAPAPAPTTNNSKSTSVSVKNTGSASGSAAGGVTVPDNGSVAVTSPVTVEPSTDQPDGVMKVQYYLGGKLVDTETKSPYKYNIDTTKLKSGTYKLTSKTYYTNGTTKQSTQNLVVKNTAHSRSTWMYALIVIVVVLGLLGINFVGPSAGDLYRRRFKNNKLPPLSPPTGTTGSSGASSPPPPASSPSAITMPQVQAPVSTAPTHLVSPNISASHQGTTTLHQLRPPSIPAPGTIFSPSKDR